MTEQSNTEHADDLENSHENFEHHQPNHNQDGTNFHQDAGDLQDHAATPDQDNDDLELENNHHEHDEENTNEEFDNSQPATNPNFNQYQSSQKSYNEQDELIATSGTRDLSKYPLRIFGALLLFLLMVLMFAGSQWGKDPQGVSYEDKNTHNATAQAQTIMQDGQKNTGIGKIASKKHQENKEAIKQAQQLAELAQTNQQQLALINDLTEHLKNADADALDAILNKYGITDPQLIEGIKKRLAQGDNLDEVLAETLKDKFVDLNNKDVHRQILDRIKNGEKIEDILDNLGFIDPKLKADISAQVANSLNAKVKSKYTPLDVNNQNEALQAEITRRTKNGEKLLDISANIEERNKIAKRLAGGEDVASVLAEYGITDPDQIAEIKKRLAKGDNIDDILADIARNNPQSQLAKLYGIQDKSNSSTNNNNNAELKQARHQHLTEEELEERKALRASIKQRKMQLFEQALTSKTTVELAEVHQAPNINASAHNSFNASQAPNTGNDELARVQAEIANQDADVSQQKAMLNHIMQMQLGGDNNENSNNSGSMGGSFLPMSNNSGGGSFGGITADYGHEGAGNHYSGDSQGSMQYANFNPNNNNANFQTASTKEPSRWDLNQTLQTPPQYTVLAGWVIPATLISGINSDLPGQIIGQVSQNIYDSATGRHLLIPQGSRLIGVFNAGVLFGQERVMIAWQRIIFPNGKNLDIGEMAGTDSAGYSGFKDQLNNHYWRTFGNAFLMGGVITTITISQNKDRKDGGNSQRASDAMSEALGQQLGQVATQMIQKNMNVAPTIEIRPGYRFNIMLSKDLVFGKPYQAFDYQ